MMTFNARAGPDPNEKHRPSRQMDGAHWGLSHGAESRATDVLNRSEFA
jgi:hypothetical protein